MKYTIITTAILSLSATTLANKSGGCGKALSGIRAGESKDFTIQSSGGTRSYRLHVPDNYDVKKATPLVFSFHGHGKTAKEQEGLSQFSQSGAGVIAVYPQGIDKQWQGDPRAPKSVSDVDFTSDLLSSISASYCVDTSRVYSAGKSNGGGFTNVLACSKTADKFAAFAMVSGAFYESTATTTNCKPSRPLPILEFHGTGDKTIPYEGGKRNGGMLPPIKTFLQEWVDRDCQGSKADKKTKELSKGVVDHESWSCGGMEGIVQHYKIDGLGHQWPSTTPNDDGGATVFNATPIILDFFKNHSLLE